MCTLVDMFCATKEKAESEDALPLNKCYTFCSASSTTWKEPQIKTTYLHEAESTTNLQEPLSNTDTIPLSASNMSSAERFSSFLKKARSRLRKQEFECPTCAARLCSQTGRQEVTTKPKKICNDCMERMLCKLHDKKRYWYDMSQAGLSHQFYRYKDVKTPKSRKIYLGEDRVV